MDVTTNPLTSFFNAIPFGDKIGPIAVALLILIVGLFIAKLIKRFLLKALRRVGFLHRSNPDGTFTDLATPIATIVYFVIVLFVLISVLAQMGLTDVLEPLKNLANQMVGYLPNIIGAGIVGYVGYILAKIVSDLVGMGLNRVDGQLAYRTGNNDLKVSGLGRAFVFAIILLPIVVAALGILDIEAISGPATAMLNQLMSAIPNIIAAGIILAVTYFVAKFVVSILTSLLDGMNFNAMPAKIGLRGLFSESFTPTKFVGGAVMFFAMLTGITAAVERLDISIVSQVMSKVLEFGGSILLGGIIIVIGNYLSLLSAKAIGKENPGLANIVRFAILGLVLAMGLRSMGLADNIVNLAFGLTIGAVAIAAAIAFGLGGRDAAKQVADNWADRITNK